MELLATGKRHLLCGEVQTAVSTLQEACALLYFILCFYSILLHSLLTTLLHIATMLTCEPPSSLLIYHYFRGEI